VDHQVEQLLRLSLKGVGFHRSAPDSRSGDQSLSPSFGGEKRE
jgi:hypothetical protein